MEKFINAIGDGISSVAQTVKKAAEEFEQEIKSINQTTLFVNVLTISAIALGALALTTFSIGLGLISGLLFVLRFHLDEGLNVRISAVQKNLKAIGQEQSLKGGDAYFFAFRRPIHIILA